MRHRKAGIKLNRTSSHRDAMFRNMVTSLFKYERIRTTGPKAKELRRWADHIITLAKRGDLHARRQALAIVREKDVVHKLFENAADRFGAVSGGYTRIVKLGRRPGDAAPISMIELIIAQDTKKKKTKKKKTKTAAAPKKAATASKVDKKQEEKPAVKAKESADELTKPADKAEAAKEEKPAAKATAKKEAKADLAEGSDKKETSETKKEAQPKKEAKVTPKTKAAAEKEDTADTKEKKSTKKDEEK